VNVSVVQTVTSITLTPTTVTVAPGGKVAFSATAYDQFSLVMTQQPVFTWRVISGRGKVSSTGVYTAPNTTGSAIVQVSAGGVKATATVYIKKAGTLARKALSRPFGGVGRDV
jgi:hypothetical protein